MEATLPNFEFRDPALPAIWEKVRARQRLSEADGLALIQTPDVTSLGKMANWEAERRHGRNAYFVTNRQCNPTNVCVLDCKFCEFARRKGQEGAWEMDREEILAHGEKVSEVHIVGGLHPDWRFDKYLGIVRDFRERFPKIGIKAWTAVEIEWFARLERRSIKDILVDLRAAGLDALPGGGAEVFSERVRKELFKPKIGWTQWREVHLTAHQLGIKTNATLLYGHIETYAERVDHMLKLRGLEDEAPGFMAFIPLAFAPGETGIPVNRQGAVEDVRTIATARLMLDNFDHIKAYWVLLSPDMASLALNFGATDLDGTIGKEKIMHMAGNKSPEGMAKESMSRLIREAGKIPVERDIFYNPVGDFGPSLDAAPRPGGHPMKFGTIPFVNMAPYYHFLSSRWLDEHQVVSGNPRQLGGLAKTNKLDAAPFSYVDGLELLAGGEFEWLDSMGISGFGPIRSILLVGAEHPGALSGHSIAVSPQTSTTVRLMEVLLRQKHGIQDFQTAAPEDPTPFRLLIGDEALRRKLQLGDSEPQMDLSEEWTQWTGKPFVFARWAVRKSLPTRDKLRLGVSVRSALELSLGDLEDVSRAQSERTGLPQPELMAYLKAIRFNLGPEELAGAALFEEKLGLS